MNPSLSKFRTLNIKTFKISWNENKYTKISVWYYNNIATFSHSICNICKMARLNGLPFSNNTFSFVLYKKNATRSQNTLKYSAKKKGLHAYSLKFEPPMYTKHIETQWRQKRNVYLHFRRPNKNNNTYSRHDDIIRSIQHKFMYLYTLCSCAHMVFQRENQKDLLQYRTIVCVYLGAKIDKAE